LADLFTSLSIGALPRLGQEPAIDGGFCAWLSKGSYQPSLSSENTKIVLENTDSRRLIEFLSFDFERFSLASCETFYIACAENNSHSLLGWPLLKLYYSAFFAAHAIMRSQGEGVVRFEKIQANLINSVIQTLSGRNLDVKAGTYNVRTKL